MYSYKITILFIILACIRSYNYTREKSRTHLIQFSWQATNSQIIS